MATTKLELSKHAAPHVRHEKILQFCEENLGSAIELMQWFTDTPWKGVLLGTGIITLTGHPAVLMRVHMNQPNIRIIHFERVTSIEVIVPAP